MRIALPIEENGKKKEIAKLFGRASEFYIYDTVQNKSFYIENKVKDCRSGAGIAAAQIIIDNEIDILLSTQCGENAAEVIKEAGIKIYKTEEIDIQKSIDNFINKKLYLLEDIHKGFHNHE